MKHHQPASIFPERFPLPLLGYCPAPLPRYPQLYRRPRRAGLNRGGEADFGNLSSSLMLGYDFVSTTNQSLTALGFWDSGANGLANPYMVGLWQTSTQTLLASATIDSADSLDGSLTVEGVNGVMRR